MRYDLLSKISNKKDNQIMNDYKSRLEQKNILNY